MQGEWKEILLENLADEITVGFVGSMTSEYVENGIPFFRSKNINPYRILWDDVKYISPQFHKKIEKSSLRPGDVVIVRTGKPGTASIIPDSIVDANCSDLVIVRPGSKLDKRFLVYYINSAASHHINAHLVGAVQQHFNVSSAKKMSIPLPTLSEQKRIAHILGSLDDKIELNRQMNATLEGMAQALFKSWFVDFDPVIDNALAAGNPIPEAFAARGETRRKALAHGTANRDLAKQFPAAFQYTEEIGWIPKGWEALPFKKFTTSKTDKVGDKDVPEYSSTNEGLFPRADRFNKQLSKSKSKNKLIHYGDLVFGMSRQVLNFGLMHQVVGSVSSAYNVFKINQSKIFPEFVENYIRARPNYYYGVLGSSSREGQSLSKSNFNLTSMLIPPGEVQEEFQKTRMVLVSKQRHNTSQSDTIANLRDTLLPKLISGEIRIPEAEKLTEEALA